MRAVLLVPMLVAGALGLAAADSESGVSKWLQLGEDLAAAEARIGQLRRETAELQRQLDALEVDPFALELAIREDLGFARSGEVVVRFQRRSPGEDSSRRLEPWSRDRGE